MGIEMKLGSRDAVQLVQTHPVCIVTTVNDEGVCDAATFSWVSPASFDPPMVAVMVSPERYTHQNLETSGEFVVNVVTKHFLDEAVYVGSVSFKDNPNKLDNSEFSLTDPKKINAPRLQEAVAWLECTVEKMVGTGDHSVVVGKIEYAEVDDEFWEDGRFLPEKAETLQHLGGNKFLVGGDLVEHED